MAKTHHFKIKDQVSEDATGAVFRAYDQSAGRKVLLRKYIHDPHARNGLHAVEEVAYQVAIERLIKVDHPSLRKVLSGGCLPKDGTPFVASRTIEAEPLESVLRQSYLSVEMATTMLAQVLELCELLSTLLAEEGVWVDTDPASISVTSHQMEPRFIFWAAPLKCLNSSNTPTNLAAIIDLTEAVMGWAGKEVDEREGGNLLPWLSWLKETLHDEGTTVREAREMLAAAAGVEPPPPIDTLLKESQRKRSLLERMPSISFKWVHRPKMPLFALLSLMFVVQCILGWLWIRKINQSIDKELKEITLSIYDDPYTNAEPQNGDQEEDNAEPGSRPLFFNE